MASNNALNTNSVPLPGSFGGTGVNNSTSTITIGGNVTFSGAYTFAGTLTGNTAVTFPTSGTLATTAGASGIVNSGLENEITYYATSGTTVSGLTGANGSVLVTDNTGVPSMLTNPGATGRMLASANSAIPAWSTSSYADTYAVSTILYASSSNTVTGLATTNRASLSTDSTGVPTWLALTDGQVVIGSSSGSPAAASLSAGTGISITPGSNSISIAATGAAINMASVTLSQSQLQSIWATPIQVVAPGGAHTIVYVNSIVCEYGFVGTAFLGGGAGILQYNNIIHGGGTSISALSPITLLVGTQSVLITVFPNLSFTSTAAITPLINAGVFVSNQTAPFTGGGASNSVKITVYYTIIPTLN